MKKILIIIITFSLQFAGCKKTKTTDEDEFSKYYFGNSTCTVNGIPNYFNRCRVTGYFGANNSDTLGFMFQIWDGNVWKESMAFTKVSNTFGRQKIHKIDYLNTRLRLASTYTTLRDDGDVICDEYQVIEKDSLINNITILSFDAITKEIRGTYDVNYLIDTSTVRCRPNNPDTLKIRNGVFYTKIL